MSADLLLSPTKITAPPLRTGIVHRPRLLTLFDDVLDRKLILVIAPAGYGKTTLLADFTRSCQMPACWLSLDALDKDPQRFFAYLIAAINKTFKSFGNISTATLRSLTNLEQESEQLIAALVNDIDQQIDQHFVLVVDDYQFVDHVPAIKNLFSRFISIAGENCHVVLASRRLPDLPDIALMVARQQVGGFEMEQLAFRTGEIRALFEEVYNIKLDDATLDELRNGTEGWITGIHLSAAGANRTATDLGDWVAKTSNGHAVRATGVDLDAYLNQQILAPQPANVRDFLLKTSLLEEFDAALCASVLGPGDWKKLIGVIQQNNLLVLPVGKDGHRLRYHHIFQDFLHRRLLEKEPIAAHDLLRRLAVVYQERHEWEKAYATIQQLNDPEMLARLVEAAGTSVLLGGRMLTLQTWLDELPTVQLDASPSLLSLKGALLCAMGNAQAASPLLDRAVDQFRAAGGTPGLTQALVRRAAARRLAGNSAGTVEDAEEAIRLAASHPGLEPEYAEALRYKGLGLSRLGQADEAITALEESLRRYESLHEAASIARLHMELGQAYRATGKWSAAAQLYQKALAEWRREGNLYSQATVLNSLGVLHHMQGNYELAVKTLQEGLDCLHHDGFHLQKALLNASLGDVLSDIDEYETAREVYEMALDTAHQVNYQFLVQYLPLAKVRLARRQGKLQEARALLERVQPGLNGYTLGLFHLENGCLLLSLEEAQKALGEMEKARQIFTDLHQTPETAWTYVWLAAAFTGSGDDAAGRANLQTALASLPPGERETAILHTLRHASPWLAGLRSDPETGALLGRVAQSGKRLPALRNRLRRVLTAVTLQSARLEIRAFGKPGVRVHGKLVTISQWQALAVRDLFFYFMSRSRPVTKEEIGEVFWPDLSPEQLRIRFKNNLYRLRRVVGQDVIVFDDDTYYFNQLTDYEYDVELFKAHLAQAATATKPAEKLTLLRDAVNLWRGPYLQDVDGLWALAERQQLERAYLDALRQIIRLQRQAGDPKAALQTCQHALVVDPCLEEFHCEAMRIHASLGDRLSVVWQYQTCCKVLSADLEMEPSEETRLLYERLIS